MAVKQKILILEDDKTIGHFMARALEESGYQVITAESAREAKMLFLSYCPSLVLLDLGLPDEDGIIVLEHMKKWHEEIPVLVVSAREREAEKVRALDMGADDYVTKPFGISELMARVRTALRHAGNLKREPENLENEVFSQNGLVLDVPHHKVTLDGNDIHFTVHEFKILELLFRHKGRVLTYSWMLKQIWGNYMTSDNQILRVNMANIRRKLKENPAQPRFIQTELGVGYRLIDDEEE